MQWRLNRSTEDSYELEAGNLLFSVSVGSSSLKSWQFLSLAIGRHSNATIAECKESWPLEAIRLARAELDRCEAELTKDA